MKDGNDDYLHQTGQDVRPGEVVQVQIGSSSTPMRRYLPHDTAGEAGGSGEPGAHRQQA